MIYTYNIITFLAKAWHDWSKGGGKWTNGKSSLRRNGKNTIENILITLAFRFWRDFVIFVRYFNENPWTNLCFHFQRRATTRKYKYFYNAIDGTPFSLGLAIPEKYGMYELLAEQEIKHSQKDGK